MNDMDMIDEVAERYVAAMTSGDGQALKKIFDPSAVIWHGTDRKEKSAYESIDSISAIFKRLSISYQDIRRSVFQNGFVQQHVVTAATTDGRPFEMAVCIVATVKNLKVTRIDEYYDSAQRAYLK